MYASDHTFSFYRKPLDTGVSINGLRLRIIRTFLAASTFLDRSGSHIGDMVALHATAVVAEVTQCLSNFRTASPNSPQMPGDIYHSSDTLGIVTKRIALGRIPFCFPPRKLSGATGSFEAGSKGAS